jgi:uncharacterized protein (DUF983 family)
MIFTLDVHTQTNLWESFIIWLIRSIYLSVIKLDYGSHLVVTFFSSAIHTNNRFIVCHVGFLTALWFQVNYADEFAQLVWNKMLVVFTIEYSYEISNLD